MRSPRADWAQGQSKETFAGNGEGHFGADGSSGGGVSMRTRFQVAGMPHAGFGFEPAHIVSLSREVARRRAVLGEAQRSAVAQTPLAGASVKSLGWPHAAHETTQGATGGVALGATPQILGRFPEMATQSAPPFSQRQEQRRPARLGRTPHVTFSGADVPQNNRAQETSLHAGGRASPYAPSEGAWRTTARHDAAGARGELDAAELLGSRPSAWAVGLAASVDASLAFALLAASHLALSVTGPARHLTDVLQNWASHEAESLGSWSFEMARVWQSVVDMPASEMELWVHGSLVFVCWMTWLALIQFFSVSAFRATVGRALVGISVNPVVSTSRGLLALPLAEVLTFGGLLSLPYALVRTDRAALARSVRFKG